MGPNIPRSVRVIEVGNNMPGTESLVRSLIRKGGEGKREEEKIERTGKQWGERKREDSKRGREH